MAFRSWIWVKDTSTGHRYDVDYRQLDRLVKKGAVEVVKDYPTNEGQNVAPRPAKHRDDLGDWQARTPQFTPQAGAPDALPARRTRTTSTATAAPQANNTEGA